MALDINRDAVRKYALRSGLELKLLEDGTRDLREYIFVFADAVIKNSGEISSSRLYPATFVDAGDESGIVVTFRDVPEAITGGETFGEALEYAKDALTVAKDFYTERGQVPPVPSAPMPGDVMVEML